MCGYDAEIFKLMPRKLAGILREKPCLFTALPELNRPAGVVLFLVECCAAEKHTPCFHQSKFLDSQVAE